MQPKSSLETMPSLAWTGERYLPNIGGDIELEHMHRYLIAMELAKDKVVLDIACGEGYGSNLLSSVARHVYAVDIAEEAVLFAQNKYKKNNLEFKLGECSHIPLPDHSVDLVISFETIEHHTAHEEMMQEITRVLRPTGILIISSPDKHEYSDVPNYKNPYHFKELYKHEFENLLKTYFKNLELLGQRVMFGSSIVNLAKNNSLHKYISFFRDADNLEAVEGIHKPLYFIAIVSNCELPNLSGGFFEGVCGEFKEKDNRITQLTTLLQEANEIHHTLTTLLQEANEEIKSTGIQLQNKEFELNEIHHTLTTLLQEANEEIKSIGIQLQNKEFELNEIHHTLNTVYASKSWRMTYPLRKGMAWIKNILRKFAKKIPLLKSAYIVYRTQGYKALFIKIMVYLQGNKINNQIDVQKNMPNQLFTQLFAQAKNDKTDYVAFAKNEKFDIDIKAIAFYLPQFYPIPENDEWWGKGFTEWANVSKAIPQFVGHYQPHLPDELGFYDLRLIEVQKQQIELAQNYGIYGFCYYHYWFGGKKLLDRPLKQVLENPQLDFPFCLCWANESWSRRWDGSDQSILVQQNYSPEDDLAFIKDIEPILRDKRYIKVNGRPLLIVYRVQELPDAKATAKRWREYCISAGIGDLYLIATQSFNFSDPTIYDFDALMEFPPHKLAQGLPHINSQLSIINHDYRGVCKNYAAIIENAKIVTKPAFTLYRTVFPSWDNEARRPGVGYTFVNASPEFYKQWLSTAIEYTHLYNDEKLVFINAWNEWAEGAHLEPDRKYGYAWLKATYDTLMQTKQKKLNKIILVSHDAHLNGAQLLTLSLCKSLAIDFAFDIDLVILGEGPLVKEFSRWATVHKLINVDPRGAEAQQLVAQLVNKGNNTAIVNSTASGLFIETLSNAALQCTALVHELPGIITSYQLENAAKIIAEKANCVIFPAPYVAEAFEQFAHISADKKKIRPQGILKTNLLKNNKQDARKQLIQELNLPANAQIILAMGYADQRKGTDLFVEIALTVAQTSINTYFVWVGKFEEKMQTLVENKLSNHPLKNRIIFQDFTDNTDMYFAGAELFALTSREDPFPSVILQSLEVAVPVLAFANAGGFSGLLEQGCGLLLPYENIAAFAQTIRELLADPLQIEKMGNCGSEIINDKFSLKHYLYDLLDWSGIPIQRISVIVPNYNYARYLSQRLSSIIQQTYPIFEIIVLDDASTDNSLEVITDFFANKNIAHKIIKNPQNSGSVFAQWKKGVELAQGDFIWICEADDLAESTFLESIIQHFADNDVVMAYSQSQQMDEMGEILAKDYLHYTNDIDCEKWKNDYVKLGAQELAEALCIKNSIPNVSAVVFRKEHLQDTLRVCEKKLLNLKIAGDWLVYAELIRHGKLAYVAKALNFHRRHQNTVTSSSSHALHLAEIIFMQDYITTLVDVNTANFDKIKNYRNYVYQIFELTPDDPNIIKMLQDNIARINAFQ